jgi:hypothetical protein
MAVLPGICDQAKLKNLSLEQEGKQKIHHINVERNENKGRRKERKEWLK